MKTYAYLNGKIVDTREPHIMLDDIGIMRSFSVFDFFRVYNGIPLHLDRHFRRITNSAKLVGLKLPVTLIQLRTIVAKLLTKNKIQHAHVRMVLTGGKMVNGLEPSTPNFYILVEEMKDLPAELYEKGAKLMTFSHQRAFSSAKTTGYMQAVVLQPQRKKAGAVEILYTDHGKVLEATTSNLFIVKKGVLITAKENILQGITRSLVIELAKKAGYTVVEREITVKELFAADEVFITATNKKVLPIVSIDGKKIGKGSVGPVSKALHDAYNAYVRTYCALK